MREGKIEHLERGQGARADDEGFHANLVLQRFDQRPAAARARHPPVAVDAAPKLEEIARERGWRTLSLR